MTSKQLNPCADCLANIETYKALQAEANVSRVTMHELAKLANATAHAAADISSRLDAALKRIGELEQVVVDCITRLEELERR